MLGQSN